MQLTHPAWPATWRSAMSQASHDHTTIRLDELAIALAQLRGLASVLGRCAISGPPLEALEAVAMVDAMLRALDAAGRLLAEARREHELSVQQGALNLSAAARGASLRVVAGLDLGGGEAP